MTDELANAYDMDEYFQSYDEDREYHRAMETDEIDWEDCGYEISDPKHPNFYDTFVDLADMPDIEF